ncbi:dipeptidase [Anaerotignum faecicola]|nr:dipeptidase [Anaerotignum faecicola]
MLSLFDSHCDTVCKAYESNMELFENNLHIDLKRMRQFNSMVQIFAVWLDKKYLCDAFNETNRRLDFYYEQVKRNENIISHCNKYSDIIECRKNGKIGGILSLEGGEAIEGSLEKLRFFYNRGVRAMTLTWNYKNEIGCGAGVKSGGISEFGFETIKEMEKLGMIIDVSHLNDDSFWDVAKFASRPFIASHSNSRKKTNVKRNLTDAQLKAVANSGGAVGINLCPVFLSRKPRAAINDVLIHIEHMVKVFGVDYIGFGCDFDGIDDTPAGIDDISCLKSLFESIEKRFGETAAEKICYKNFMRVLSKII